MERARFQYNLAEAQTKRGEAQAARTAQREEERAEMRFHDQDPFLNEDQRRSGVDGEGGALCLGPRS